MSTTTSDTAKRALDAFLAFLFLVLLALPMGLIALLVKLTSPGPVFFSQQRVGRNGEPFQLYKFRSMCPAAAGPSVTAGGDARITPVGKRLRAWKLDELPQLFNVLRGDMSLVGPRPEVPEYVQHYTEEQREVLSVRPGVTGVSQLEFRHEEALLAGRSDVESFYIQVVMPAKLALDLRYVQERSLLGDLHLLILTLAALFRRSSPVAALRSEP